jgi:hypothetical protein
MRLKKHRIHLFVILCLLVPIGLGTKFYAGPFEAWIHSFAGDILYPVFWMFLIFFIKPKWPVPSVSGIVFLSCTLVEISQLFSTPGLQELRSTFIGRTLFGTHFVFMDILYYAVGCLFGAFTYHRIKHLTFHKNADPQFTT